MAGKIIGRVAIKVIPDTSGFREDVANDLKGREKPGNVTVKVIPELDKTVLRKIKKDLQNWADKISPLKINVRPELLPTSHISARLAYLGRPRDVEFVPRLNNVAAAKVATALAAMSGARVLSDALDNIIERLGRLDKSVPIIGTMALAIAGLGSYGLATASNLFALSASLAQIGGAALALPGILGGLIIGLGATIAVFKDFNQVIPEMADKLADLQNRMSANFWKVAEDPIRNMIDNLWPAFSNGIEVTATALGGFFGGLANQLSVMGPSITQMFQDLNESIEIFTKHTPAIGQIIDILGRLGAGQLPELAGWVGEVTDKFAAWLEKAEESGKLTEWVDNGIFQLQEFGRVLGNLGGIFHGLADAATAAGGATLTGLADSLQRIEDKVKSDGFSNRLTAVLATAHNMMTQIANISGPAVDRMFANMADTFTVIGPMIGNTIGTALSAVADALASPAIQNGLVNLFAGLNSGVASLAPAMQPLANMIGALMPVIAELAETLGSVLGAAITAISPLFVSVTDSILPLIDMLGGTLTGVINSLAPSLANLGTTISSTFEVLIPALQPLIEFIGNLASAILPMLIDGISQVLVAIQPLIVLFGQLVEVLGPILIPIITFIADLLITSLVGAINGVVNVIIGFAGIFVGIWNMIVGFFQVIIGVFMAIFTGNTDMLKAGWDKLWKGIVTIFVSIWTLIKGLFQVFLNVGILGVARKIFLAVKAFFKNIWKDIATVFKEAWDSIRNRFTTALNQMKSKGESILNAIKGFFKGVWGDIKAALSLAWQAIKSTFSSSIEGWKNIVNNGWTAIKNFFTRGVTSVKNKVAELPGKVGAVFTGAATILYDAGVAIIKGLIDGIGDKVEDLKDKLGAVTKLIPDWKGPADTDKRLLTPAGQLIMEGLIRGFDNRLGHVRKVLMALTDEIGSTTTKAVAKAAPRMGEGIAKGLIYGLSQARRPAIRAAEDLGAQIAGALTRTLNQSFRVAIVGDYSTHSGQVESVDLGHRLSGLEKQISRSAAQNAGSAPNADAGTTVQIDNILIPLEDLAQLRTLEEFLEMLRVRTRQGAA